MRKPKFLDVLQTRRGTFWFCWSRITNKLIRIADRASNQDKFAGLRVVSTRMRQKENK